MLAGQAVPGPKPLYVEPVDQVFGRPPAAGDPPGMHRAVGIAANSATGRETRSGIGPTDSTKAGSGLAGSAEALCRSAQSGRPSPPWPPLG